MTKRSKTRTLDETDAKRDAKLDTGAYERGAKAGKQSNPTEGNPYAEGSPAAKSFEHGQLDAQKVRSSDKPPGR
ncbi:hypothetical protein [Rhizobium miluonense]|jgi:hypothetical protein|uniref:Stress-induced acidophilic repeat motif-containing protein n=1 Tax=Rhizobium miluonense TaxID=411945 RepID=A0ABU1SXT8_9HYPH|nr:hypothetical protein [Rhizobium miluonense]MDR6903698.1 hypothetical protein [Rhizobium miluonense]